MRTKFEIAKNRADKNCGSHIKLKFQPSGSHIRLKFQSSGSHIKLEDPVPVPVQWELHQTQRSSQVGVTSNSKIQSSGSHIKLQDPVKWESHKTQKNNTKNIGADVKEIDRQVLGIKQPNKPVSKKSKAQGQSSETVEIYKSEKLEWSAGYAAVRKNLRVL